MVLSMRGEVGVHEVPTVHGRFAAGRFGAGHFISAFHAGPLAEVKCVTPLSSHISLAIVSMYQ